MIQTNLPELQNLLSVYGTWLELLFKTLLHLKYFLDYSLTIQKKYVYVKYINYAFK